MKLGTTDPLVRSNALQRNDGVVPKKETTGKKPGDVFGGTEVHGSGEVGLKRGGVLAELDEACSKAGRSLSDCGQELKTAGAELASSEVGVLGDDTCALSNEMSSPTSTVRETNRLHAAIVGLHERAKSLVSDLGDAVGRGYERLTTQVGKLADTAKAFASDVTHATDVEHNVEQLGANDTYVLFAHGYLSAGLKLAANAAVVTARGENGFFVEAGADLLAGAMVGFGADLGPLGKSIGEVGAVVGGGGAVAFRFETAADATRAAKLLAKGGVTLSSDDVAFLEANVASVELKGSAFADLLNAFSLSSLVGTSQYGRATASVSLVLENPGGESPALVVRSKLDGHLVGTLDAQATPGDDWLGLVAGVAKGQATLTSERRVSLPAGTTAKTLLSTPGLLKRLKDTDELKSTFTLTREAGSGGRNRGQLVTLWVDGGIGEAAKAWLKGDVQGTLGELPGGKVKGQLADYQEYGVELFPKVSVNGVGAGLLLIAQRQDVQLETAKSFELDPSKAGAAVKKFLSRSL